MSGRRPGAVLDVCVLFTVALVINSVAAQWITQPGYVDAYYYFEGALQLARGQGFTEPYLWNYLGSPAAAGPPWRWPGFLFWMPLSSIVAAPVMAAAESLAGGLLPQAQLFRAAQLPFIGLASLLPLLSYTAAGMMGLGRRPALAAAALTLFSPFHFAYWTNTDAFAMFGVAASAAMLGVEIARRRPLAASRWLFAAGLAAGLAHLARADGLLVLACLVVWVAWRPPVGQKNAGRVRAVAVLAAGYMLAMLPWMVRNIGVDGAPLPPGGLQTAWLTNYDELFAFPADRISPSSYLASGLGNILAGKWAALSTNLVSLAAAQGGLVAFPFMVIGAWRLRREPLMALGLFYGVALLAVMSLVFTFPGMRGGYFHSGAALLPIWMPAAAAGLDAAVEAAARRLPHWQPQRSRPVFSVLLVMASVALSAAVYYPRVIGRDPSRPAWSALDQGYRDAGDWLRAEGRDTDLVVVNNPPGWHYWTNQAAIVLPSGGRAELAAVMRHFNARWVYLDSNHPVPLTALYLAPEADRGLQLRARFAGANGMPAYLFEAEPGS